ncbi:MAG TPA: hypothetical protein VG819_13045 [Rhizomicrobium sp.]|jgi:hypothetical protein|nr:hypothetical protein [Rhizomicrobium sp.]
MLHSSLTEIASGILGSLGVAVLLACILVAGNIVAVLARAVVQWYGRTEETPELGSKPPRGDFP